jgi:uncharacterized protein
VRKASRDFQIFAKPAGALCNLDCHYCYYLDKQRLYPKSESRMADDLLEAYIIQHIETSPGSTITFSWHGGEPTVVGLEYFRKIVALKRKHQSSGRRILNGIQTNGVLLDEEWCRFFKAEGFGVGLSIDGPAEMHDRYRVTRGQEPTHKQTIRAFELLRRHGVPCDILCAIHDQNVQHPIRLYRFFKELGAQYLGFLPVVERMPGAESDVRPYTVPSEAFGTFLCSIFEEWAAADTERIMVQIFEEASRPLRGMEHSLCVFRETCGDIPVIEHNGDFFSCDHFVDPEHRLGNVRETPLVELLESPAQIAFGLAKRDALPRCCRQCEVRSMCNGGCPKDRFVRTPDGETGLNYLCTGFKTFFTHSRPHLMRLESQRRAQLLAERLMPPAQTTCVKAAPQVGRNEPCPCGSGRKYKKCCLGK